MTLDHLPRLSLGAVPTPVEPLARLGAAIGVDLSVKRDDLTGFGGGGNKVRKLEFLMADAKAKGASVVLTAGGLQSNHARITAAAARRCGMTPVLVLRGEKPPAADGNLLLDHLFGAEIDYLDAARFPAEHEARMQALGAAAEARGETAYVIPVGGSNALGAAGYVACALELAEQYRAAGRPAPDVLLVTVGSGGTLAGLTVGCAAVWPQTRVVGVTVSISPVPFADRVARIANAVAELVGVGRRWQPAEIALEQGYVGAGYAIMSEAGNAAIRLAARTEGMLLDPVYTAKGFAGLIGSVETGVVARGSSVLFLHTGGTPALFHYGEALLS